MKQLNELVICNLKSRKEQTRRICCHDLKFMRFCNRRCEEGMIDHRSSTCIASSRPVKLKPEKNTGLNGIWTHDLSDTDKINKIFHIWHIPSCLKVTVNFIFPGVIYLAPFLRCLCSDFWLFNTAKYRNNLLQVCCWISTQSIITSCVSE